MDFKFRPQLSLYAAQDQQVPKPEWLTIKDYAQMLTMTNTRRRNYYRYLFGSYIRNENERVNFFS